MHNALLISEVLHRIVDHLAGDTAPRRYHTLDEDFDRADQQALAALARTCRAFSEPALNGLWCRLNSGLRPLLLCSSTENLELLDNIEEDAVLSPFNEAQWNTVLRYTPRIRDLTIRHDELSEKILQSLWFRTTRLLPNLRRLHWVTSDATSVTLIRLLLGPSLVRLDMQIDSGLHTSFLAFLESCHTLCPNLKSLNFHCAPSTPEVTAAVSRAICASDLEALGSSGIDEAAFIYVTQSRSLQEFRCSLLDHLSDDLSRLAACRTLEHPPFENVRILDLRIQYLSTIIPFLRSECQPFEAITFHLHSVPTARVVHEFFIALCSTTRRKTLQAISLYTTGYLTIVEEDTPPQPIDFQVLSSLMTLNLHRFHLCMKNPVSLNDDEFVRLVQAWPELNTLYLNKYNDWSCPASIHIPTLRGLVLLLARCPKLYGLGLSLDATNVPSLSGAESLIRSTAVTRLSITNSPIREPVANVARFLREHLPSLTAVEVCVSCAGRMDYHWMWKRVDREIENIIGRPPTPEYDGFI